MRNFNNKRIGGRDSGGFGGRDSGNFRGRSQGRSEMHRTTCTECGNQCEVPFKPRGDKPVYCDNCFKKDSHFEPRQSGGRRNSGRDFGRSNFGERERRMHKATCAECGGRCEVPFKPTGEKPVYCSDCFGGGGGHESKKTDSHKENFETLNKKLDKVLKILEIIRPPKKQFIIEKSELPDSYIEVSKETKEKKETKPAKKKKKVEKKATKKKTPAKKTAKKTPAKKAVKKTTKKAVKKATVKKAAVKKKAATKKK